jgi:WD40 repeat protein
MSNFGGFSADGTRLAFGGYDGSVKLCDANTGQILHSIEKAGEIVALLADGKTVATTDKDFLLKLWDFDTGRATLVLPGPGGFNNHDTEFGVAVSITRDGRTLAVIETNYQGVAIWDVATQRVLSHLPDKRALLGLQFSPDGKILATGGFDGAVNLWNVLDGRKPILEIPAHEEPVFAIAFSPDGRRLATGSTDQSIKLWDAASGRGLATFRGHESVIWAVAFSPDGKLLASGSQDQTVKIWDVERRPTQQTLTNVVGQLAWSPDSRTVATGCEDGTVTLRDAATLQPLVVLTNAWSALGFSRDGETVLTRLEDGTLQFWETASRKGRQEVPAKLRKEARSAVKFEDWTRVAVSPDRRVAAVGTDTGTVHLWETASGKTEQLTGHTRRVGALAFSPSGDRLISGGFEGSINIHDVISRKCLASFAAHPMRVYALVFSPDGKMFASGSVDNSIKLWDLKTRKLLKTLNGHKRLIWSVAFSPDGRMLASSSSDRTVRLWNVALGTEVTALRLYFDPTKREAELISFLEFSPDGNTLATITREGTLKLLRAATFQAADRVPR